MVTTAPGSKCGDVPHSTTLFNDAKVVLDDLTRQQTLQHPELPLIAPLLFGYSMGGLFAARLATAQLSPLRGLILSSPGLALSLGLIQGGLLKVMSALARGVASAERPLDQSSVARPDGGACLQQRSAGASQDQRTPADQHAESR